MIGMFVFSKAGHDKNQVYVVVKEEQEYVYLVDGRLKLLNKPKKKNKKHIQLISRRVNQKLQDNLNDSNPVYDEELKRAIKLLKEEISNK